MPVVNCVQIGGQARVYGSTREIGSDRLAVTRFAGREYYTTYSVAELYREILQEREDRDRPKQQTLW